MIYTVVSPTILFLLYIQFSPKMGNVWYRDGHFTPQGALNLMIYPFQNILMWNPKVWDINYPIWIIISAILHDRFMAKNI